MGPYELLEKVVLVLDRLHSRIPYHVKGDFTAGLISAEKAADSRRGLFDIARSF
jgi:hypothetical protein